MEIIWKGNFIFDPAKPGPLTDKVLTCELQLSEDAENNISGKFIHEDYYNQTQAEATVTGFRDENFISLVAVFPYRFYYDDEGKMLIDPDRANHELTLYAELSEDGKKIIGDWEIVERTALELDTINVFYSCGFFEMDKS